MTDRLFILSQVGESSRHFVDDMPNQSVSGREFLKSFNHASIARKVHLHLCKPLRIVGGIVFTL